MESELFAFLLLREPTASWHEKRGVLYYLIRPVVLVCLLAYTLYYVLIQHSSTIPFSLYQYQWGLGMFLLIVAVFELFMRALVSLAKTNYKMADVKLWHVLLVTAFGMFWFCLMRHWYDLAFWVGVTTSFLFLPAVRHYVLLFKPAAR